MELERRIAAFQPSDFAGRRYANLVKHQYALLNTRAPARLRPDTGFEFRDYRFYPVFLQAVRFKRNAEDSLAGEREAPPETARVLERLLDQCLDLIDESPMNATRKRYYQWHVTDALRWKGKPGKDDGDGLDAITGGQAPGTGLEAVVKPPARDKTGTR
jgi:hypothetical protein